MRESFIGMFAAMDGARMLGVYREAAQAGQAQEIAVRQLTGSPETEGCIWLAEGVWSTVTMADGVLKAEHCDVGPSWGANPQSAIAGLCGATFNRRGVELTRLQCWPVGQRLAEPPDNLAQEWPYDTIIHRAMPTLPDLEEALVVDYPALRRRGQEADEALREKRGSEELAQLTARLMREGMRRWHRDPSAEGVSLRRAERVTERKLCGSFTLREMQILCVLLKLCGNPEIEGQLDSGAIPREECRALRKRLSEMVMTVRSPVSRRIYVEE